MTNGIGGSVSFYLVSFSKIVEVLFSNLEGATVLNQKFVLNSLKLMEIPNSISALHKKLTEDKKGEKDKKDKDSK